MDSNVALNDVACALDEMYQDHKEGKTTVYTLIGHLQGLLLSSLTQNGSHEERCADTIETIRRVRSIKGR